MTEEDFIAQEQQLEQEAEAEIGCYLCKRIYVLHRIGHAICMECEDNMEREEFNE